MTKMQSKSQTVEGGFKMKVSYIKTQWWRILIALICLTMCCIYVFKRSPDTSTIEGLDTLITYMFNANIYFLGFIIWMVISFINYIDDRVRLLEAEKERNDAIYELVQELIKANKIDREVMNKYEETITAASTH